MKKHMLFSFLLAVVLLVCSAGGALAGTEGQVDEMDIYEYVKSLFGYEEERYYPSRPTFLDPMSYCGYVSLGGGVKGDTYYVAYAAWSEDDVALYRGYLEYWGYVGAPMDCDLPGVTAWRMTSTETAHEGRPLMQTVDVYHAAERELMVVAYSYLDAWIYDEWLANPDWGIWRPFAPVELPVEVQLAEDVTVTVEEYFITDDLFVLADSELNTYPYGESILEERGIYIKTTNIGQTNLHHAYRSESGMLCVRVSFDASVSSRVIPSLRAATAIFWDEESSDIADCADVSILQLAPAPEDEMLYVLPAADSCTELWLVFPAYQDEYTARLYLCLEDENNPWIGDLRDWEYVNFQIR